MLGILFVTAEEAAPFLQTYERGRFDGLTEGDTFHDEQVLVTIIGTGKIKATLRTERLLQTHKLTRLVHAGTCTSLKDELKPGTIVAASQVFEGDRIELAAPTYPRMPLAVIDLNLTTGTLVTQDHTVQDTEEFTYWQRIADFSDMTGYAVAYVAATHGVPCHVTKVVSGHLQQEDPNLRRTLNMAHERLSEYLTGNMEGLLKGVVS